MQVKIFEETSPRELEKQINYWLAQAKPARIHFVTQSAASMTKGQQQLAATSLFIFYDPPEKV